MGCFVLPVLGGFWNFLEVKQWHFENTAWRSLGPFWSSCPYAVHTVIPNQIIVGRLSLGESESRTQTMYDRACAALYLFTRLLSLESEWSLGCSLTYTLFWLTWTWTSLGPFVWGCTGAQAKTQWKSNIWFWFRGNIVIFGIQFFKFLGKNQSMLYFGFIPLSFQWTTVNDSKTWKKLPVCDIVHTHAWCRSGLVPIQIRRSDILQSYWFSVRPLGPNFLRYATNTLYMYKDLNENPETFRLQTFLPLRFIATVFFCHSFDSVSMVTQWFFDSLAGPKFGSPPPRDDWEECDFEVAARNNSR